MQAADGGSIGQEPPASNRGEAGRPQADKIQGPADKSLARPDVRGSDHGFLLFFTVGYTLKY